MKISNNRVRENNTKRAHLTILKTIFFYPFAKKVDLTEIAIFISKGLGCLENEENQVKKF